MVMRRVLILLAMAIVRGGYRAWSDRVLILLAMAIGSWLELRLGGAGIKTRITLNRKHDSTVKHAKIGRA